MTLDKVICQLCQSEFAAGLTYTGCSRVKTKENLAILGYTNHERLGFPDFPPFQK